MIAEISSTFGALPAISADTFAGQVAWFFYGFAYSAFVGSVAFMIWLFRRSGGGGGPAEN